MTTLTGVTMYYRLLISMKKENWISGSTTPNGLAWWEGIRCKPPGDVIGWGKIASMIGMALAPEYWTTDGSSDPAKLIKGNTKDPALQAVGAAENGTDFMQNKNGFWIDKKPYENYKTIREIGYGRPDGRVKMYVDEFVEVGFNGLPTFQPRWTEPEGEYQFSLLVTRSAWHMHADPNFIDNPVLNMLSVKNHIDCVWISPAAGQQLMYKMGTRSSWRLIPSTCLNCPGRLKPRYLCLHA